MECYDRVWGFLRGALYGLDGMEIVVEMDRTFDPAGPDLFSCLPGENGEVDTTPAECPNAVG